MRQCGNCLCSSDDCRAEDGVLYDEEDRHPIARGEDAIYQVAIERNLAILFSEDSLGDTLISEEDDHFRFRLRGCPIYWSMTEEEREKFDPNSLPEYTG